MPLYFRKEEGDSWIASGTTSPLRLRRLGRPRRERALDWAPRFYGARDLDIMDVAFKIKPARFWLVTFRRPDAGAPLFAVVLSDEEILDPRVLIGI